MAHRPAAKNYLNTPCAHRMFSRCRFFRWPKARRSAVSAANQMGLYFAAVRESAFGTKQT